MKKIIFTLFIISVSFVGFSRGRTYYTKDTLQCSGGKYYQPGSTGSCGSCILCDGVLYGNQGSICPGVEGRKSCCAIGYALVSDNNCKPCDGLTAAEVQGLSNEQKSNCRSSGCPQEKQYDLQNGAPACCLGVVESGICYPSLGEYGIDISTECLLDGQCGLNVYKVMGIRKSNENPTVLGFFQDITLASTTVILGTVLVLALVIGGLSWSIASVTGKDPKKGKTIIVACLVGTLLIMGSYAIIRLIQFLALAGS